MVQKKMLPVIAIRNIRSARSADQAPLSVAANPPSARAG